MKSRKPRRQPCLNVTSSVRLNDFLVIKIYELIKSKNDPSRRQTYRLLGNDELLKGYRIGQEGGTLGEDGFFIGRTEDE